MIRRELDEEYRHMVTVNFMDGSVAEFHAPLGHDVTYDSDGYFMIPIHNGYDNPIGGMFIAWQQVRTIHSRWEKTDESLRSDPHPEPA